MIWYWIILGVQMLVWIFKLPSPQDIARIDPNAWCPVCGERKGRIRCVVQAEARAPAKNIVPNMKIQCQHTCNECGARWFEQPIAKEVSPATVLPSVARTKLEQAEDRQAFLQAQKQE